MLKKLEVLRLTLARNETHIKNQELYVVGYEGYKQQIDEKIEVFKEEIANQQLSDKELREAVELYKSNLDQELKEISDRVIDQQNYNDNYKNRLETFTEEYRKEIDDKVNGIQQEILRSDADLKIQNSNISDIKESVQSAIKKLNYDEIEKKKSTC